MATAELDIKIDSRDVPNATKQLQQLEKAGASAEKGVGSMRGAMQNLSYQLQDVAVQAQMGTSGLTILAQQGPQIASAFGPAGAAAGALIGIGAMIMGVANSSTVASESLDDMMERADEMGKSQLAYAMIKANDALEEATKKADEARVKFEQVSASQAQSGLTAGIYAEKIIELKANHERLSDEQERAAEVVARLGRLQDGTTTKMENASKAIRDLTTDIQFQTSIMEEASWKQAILSKLHREGVDANSDEGKAVMAAAAAYNAKKESMDANEAAQKRGVALAEQAARAAEQQAKADARKREMQLQSAQAWLERANQLGATELEQIDYWHQQELAKLREFEQQKALTAMEVDTARKALDEESARRRIELEDKVLQKSLEASRLKAQAEKQATTQMASMQWGLASQSLDAISMAAEEGSTMQKAAFVAGKGMAAAQAIMQAELASVSTLAAYAAAAAAAGAGGPALLAAGTAQAAAMKTMGYASAAIIAAQGFAGMFDNGGNIGSGQWGIVGENGPEIVKGPANVTSRKKTAAMAASAMGGDSGGMVFNVYQTITGNGDQALAEVVDRATKSALNEVQRDFATNGRIRKTAGV